MSKDGRRGERHINFFTSPSKPVDNKHQRRERRVGISWGGFRKVKKGHSAECDDSVWNGKSFEGGKGEGGRKVDWREGFLNKKIRGRDERRGGEIIGQ